MSQQGNNYFEQGSQKLVVGGDVDVLPSGKVLADGTQASAIPALTGTVGTASDDMTAIAAPTDAPATADALRDDLAAVMVPAINNNFADLQAKVNAILAALRGVGIIASA